MHIKHVEPDEASSVPPDVCAHENLDVTCKNQSWRHILVSLQATLCLFNPQNLIERCCSFFHISTISYFLKYCTIPSLVWGGFFFSFFFFFNVIKIQDVSHDVENTILIHLAPKIHFGPYKVDSMAKITLRDQRYRNTQWSCKEENGVMWHKLFTARIK